MGRYLRYPLEAGSFRRTPDRTAPYGPNCRTPYRLGETKRTRTEGRDQHRSYSAGVLCAWGDAYSHGLRSSPLRRRARAGDYYVLGNGEGNRGLYSGAHVNPYSLG